jgi:hypothetical protein
VAAGCSFHASAGLHGLLPLTVAKDATV